MLFPDISPRVRETLNIAHWSSTMKIGSLLTAVAVTAVACSAQAVSLPGPVVSADWLHKNRTTKGKLS